MRRAVLPLLLLLLAFAPAAPGQAKTKPPPKNLPKVLMALPLGVPAGTTTRLALRGLRLDGATEVKVAPKGSVKVLKKNKVPVPNQADPNKVGDSQVEVELTVPADFPGDRAKLTVRGPGGESRPHEVLIDRAPVLNEKEPNDGFKAAQKIAIGQVVQGAIAAPLDVDCFRFEGKAGQRVVVEIFAARHGSALDAILTLYDERGQKVAEKDSGDGVDPRLELALPRAGAYFVCIQDAHDQGGATHVYRLLIRGK
jgi:hypothetical protein